MAGIGQRDAHATGEQHHMSSYQALAFETVTTPAGTFSNALHIREQRGPDYVRDVWYAPGVGMVRWIDGVEEGLLASRTLPAQPVPPVTRVVEYYHAGLDHYFMTADPAEIDALDTGRLTGWQRTGMGFNVVVGSASAAGGASAVCRYYGRPEAGLDTHFYSASPEECAAVARKWPDQWLLESSNVFQIHLPEHDVRCLPCWHTADIPHLERAGRHEPPFHAGPLYADGHDGPRACGGGLWEPTGRGVFTSVRCRSARCSRREWLQWKHLQSDPMRPVAQWQAVARNRRRGSQHRAARRLIIKSPRGRRFAGR